MRVFAPQRALNINYLRALRVRNCERRANTTRHCYSVEFHSPYPYSVKVRMFAGLSYINDISHSSLGQLPAVDKNDTIQRRDMDGGSIWNSKIRIHNPEGVDLYILQVFLFADASLFFCAANFFGAASGKILSQ